MTRYTIDVIGSVLGDLEIYVPVSSKECIGEDLFNYSNSTITGVVMDSNNNVRYYVRWPSWSYPQYRSTSYNQYYNLLNSNTAVGDNTTYLLYGSEASDIVSHSDIIAVVCFVIIAVCAVMSLFRGRC